MSKYVIISVFLCMFLNAQAQERLILKSKVIPENDTVIIYKPDNYNETKHKYPVVIMLHGWSGNYMQWNQIIDLQKYADSLKFVIVCPDGFYNSWYINSPLKKDSQYTTFFFKTFMPEIKSKNYVDTTKIFITGLSMGGHGTIYLFQEQPHTFLAVASTSGVLNLRTKAVKNFGLLKLIGEKTQKNSNWDTYSVVNRLDKIKGTKKKILIDCGTEDPFYETSVQFHEKCKTLNINIIFNSQAGNHNPAYWSKSIQTHFDFFNKIIQ